MKKIFYLLIFTFLMTYCNSQWVSLNSNVTNDLKSICFTDSTTGYAVGAEGLILKTIDRGLNWISKNSETTESLNAVCFITTQIGYAVGSNGTILRTSNAGDNWTTLISNTTNELYSISFSESKFGAIVGFKGSFLNSSDSGLTWTHQTGPLGEIPYALSIQMINQDTGYAAGSYTSFYRTNDGGASWEGKTVINFSDPPYKHFKSIFFTTPDIGFATGINYYDGSSDKELICKTIDGGENWTDLTKELYQPINSIYFFDSLVGYAVGDAGTILKTIDGCKNWTQQNNPTDKNLNSVFFIDSVNGYAVGNGGSILKTNKDYTSLNEVKTKFELSVSPNPADASITFQAKHPGFVKIFDINGKLVLNMKISNLKSQLDVSTLPKGVYFVRYDSYNIIKTIKLIKK